MSQSPPFGRFYETWLEKLHTLVEKLKSAPKPPTSADDNQILVVLVEEHMSHYEEYFRVKKLAANSDVLSLFSTEWLTSLENSLHWVAGFRPTTVFHLVYTESSILFESHILDILQGRRTGDLGDLSPDQLSLVSEIQCETVREENAITDELSEWQEGASDLLFAVRSTDLDPEIRRLVRVVEKADDLRLSTIRRVAELLTAQQAVEFFVAAAELQFGLRGWGLTQETQRVRHTNNNNNHI